MTGYICQDGRWREWPSSYERSFGRKQTIPCGQSIGCRLERCRQWAVRCMHEASLYSSNCFLTLTYRPEDLPECASLVPDDLTKFIKRLRKAHCGIDPVSNPHFSVGSSEPQYIFPIRYYACVS